MLDIGWTEMLVIAVVAVVVIGPKELPRALRTAGQLMRKARGLARDFQHHIDDMVRESELDELRQKADAFKSDPTSFVDNTIGNDGEKKAEGSADKTDPTGGKPGGEAIAAAPASEPAPSGEDKEDATPEASTARG